MANSDYEKRGSGAITPSAELAGSMGEGSLSVSISNFVAGDNVVPYVGQAVMIEGEIARITSVAMPVIGLARGCADTVPAKHLFGARVWFLNSEIGTDGREYMATEAIGVKLLMRSISGSMEPRNSPPQLLQFNSRVARPYPPGRVRVNGTPWHRYDTTLNDTVGGLTLTWAHRDRILQHDTLQDHEAGSIGPEPGTTYLVRFYDDQGVLKRSIDVGLVDNYTYSVSNGIEDLGVLPADGLKSGWLTLHAVRNGLLSWQGYSIQVGVDINDIERGWGNGWGNAFGQ